MILRCIHSTMQGVKRAIMQDMLIIKKHASTVNLTQSSVSAVECYVCGKGIQDGYSITAKTFHHGTVLFCDMHYSLQ